MTTDEMDNDLATYHGFDALSARVGYWRRRFALKDRTSEQWAEFDAVVGKHSARVLSLLRAG
jgi:phosphate-selective porin